jgi:hypothetical protein
VSLPLPAVPGHAGCVRPTIKAEIPRTLRCPETPDARNSAQLTRKLRASWKFRIAWKENTFMSRFLSVACKVST